MTPPPKVTGFNDSPKCGESLQVYFLGNFVPISVSVGFVSPGCEITDFAEYTS